MRSRVTSPPLFCGSSDSLTNAAPQCCLRSAPKPNFTRPKSPLKSLKCHKHASFMGGRTDPNQQWNEVSTDSQRLESMKDQRPKNSVQWETWIKKVNHKVFVPTHFFKASSDHFFEGKINNFWGCNLKLTFLKLNRDTDHRVFSIGYLEFCYAAFFLSPSDTVQVLFCDHFHAFLTTHVSSLWSHDCISSNE